MGRDADRILAVIKAARDVSGGTRCDVEISHAADRIPAVLLVPHAEEPLPAALLLHGLGSEKERMADTIGEALMRHGIAALAVDLPMHGARAVAHPDWRSGNAADLLGTWKGAADEARVALEYLESHDAIDAGQLAIVGYSLGSFVANIVAAESPNVRALVLAASGDLPEGLQFESLVRSIVDPLRAVRATAARPLLMINGRFDRTVRASQAERLFAAAQEPKTMRWYGGGHWPPAREIEYAAEWLSLQLAGRSRPEHAERSG